MVKGRALDDGGIGDMVRVQSDLSVNKVLYGEVLNASVVKMAYFN